MTAKLAPASLRLSIAAWKQLCRSGMLEPLHEMFQYPRIFLIWLDFSNYDMYWTCPAHAQLTLLPNNGRNPTQQLTICAQNKWLKLKHLSGKHTCSLYLVRPVLLSGFTVYIKYKSTCLLFMLGWSILVPIWRSSAIS
jgi:hypothetical protein